MHVNSIEAHLFLIQSGWEFLSLRNFSSNACLFPGINELFQKLQLTFSLTRAAQN